MPNDCDTPEAKQQLLNKIFPADDSHLEGAILITNMSFSPGSINYAVWIKEEEKKAVIDFIIQFRAKNMQPADNFVIHKKPTKWAEKLKRRI
jgi:hypothetical protein